VGDRIRILIVEASSHVRQSLASLLSGETSIEIIGTASDPFNAARKMAAEGPDLILLGTQFQTMSSSVFVSKIMTQFPLPIIICASEDDRNSQEAKNCLLAGALEIFHLPRNIQPASRLAKDIASDLIRTINLGANKVVYKKPPLASSNTEPKLTADVILPPPVKWTNFPKTDKIVCIGVSTGGPESLKVVLQQLPANSPGIVIVQHMPENFTPTFAQRMNDYCISSVKEAAAGDVVRRGRVLIAPGNRHTLVRRNGDGYVIDIKDGPPVSRHRPSADVLFRSAARNAGPNAVGVIMTGMGDDGAQGMLEMKNVGSYTIAESEDTCVVFGMPKEAIARGGVKVITRLEKIAEEIGKACK